jgi:hypothetical protein
MNGYGYKQQENNAQRRALAQYWIIYRERNMNNTEAAQLVGVLAAGYPQWQVTKETVAIWADLFSDLDYAATRTVVREWLLTEDRPPSPAAIRRGLASSAGLTAPTRATAWAEVRSGISTSKDGGKPAFTHPAISKAVDTIGWWEIRHSTNLDTLRSQFWKVYEEYAMESDKEVMTTQHLSLGGGERKAIVGVQTSSQAS